ncbi:Gldg family protein [Sphingobacterium yanglingense]|uniref:ABC-2 type transport system permease protein n=1 Tax=Sphingobacterium yanglingense TaxID=1437280 RepID=A0A4R6WJL0_9SPHI|nr:Gldg family protein [Sphingobacterium yanglingense]TDQ77920.1 ABC-2 type transport system permease protein [Sphingobacterium yanglingense]
MKTILRIARVELSALFYSPIAWFLLILFYIQVSMSYLDQLTSLSTHQELGNSLSNLTFEFFASPRGGLFITGVLRYLYLYIPLITMGLISRETHSGTIKLLYSSPVKLSSIVLGKYVSMLFFNLCLILVLFITIIFASSHIEAMDYGLVFSGLLGIYLLLSAYAAIGLFMSSLSQYQVVAAIATFAVFALLKFVGTVWQEYDLLREVTGYLSISGRTESMIMGLVTTKEVIYYILITAMFLAFTFLKLRGGRDSSTWAKSAVRYSLVVVCTVVIGYISSMPGFVGYWDTTRTQSSTISSLAQKELKGLVDGPLTVTTYANLLDQTFWFARPEYRKNDIGRWEPYVRFKSDIKLNFVNYYDSVQNDALYKENAGKTLDEIAKKQAKAFQLDLSWFKKPEEIRQMINLRPEKNRLVMELEYKGKKTFLRVFDDLNVWPSEVEVVAAVKRLTEPVPQIAFLQGEDERSIDKPGDKHYKFATSEVNTRAALVNQGFDVLTLSLSDQDIPEGLTALVIADPRTEFSPVVLAKIERYIKEGGNLLLAGEPGKQSVLNPILKHLGVQLMDGTIVQGDTNFSPDAVSSYVSYSGDAFGTKIAGLHRTKSPINTPGVAGLTYQTDGNFKVQTLLQTDENVTWNKTGKVVLDSADIVYNPEGGDVKRSLPTAIYLTRQVGTREQRILVTGDADFLSNVELARKFPQTGNSKFFQGFLGWFSYGQFPIQPTFSSPTDNILHMNSDDIKSTKRLMLFLVPSILLLAGTILLVRRKRK